MLLVTAMAFLLLEAVPLTLGHCIYIATGKQVTGGHVTDHVILLIRQVVITMEQLNYSINFLVYVLCSRAFRIEFLRIILRKRLRDHDQ